jgi:HAD superfamily hydrolase (TIGR01549 family)
MDWAGKKIRRDNRRMHYKAILFDMDGTLVPMDNDVFTTGYFKGLCKKLAHFGMESRALVDAVWTGTKDMVLNDGTRSNEEAFWKKFCLVTGLTEEPVRSEALDFYENEFREAKIYTGDNPLAVRAVKAAREKAERVVLATNPLFPMVGQRTRMAWVGLKEEDFDLVTCYESDSFCKPNPAYFVSVCERIGLSPEDCLMIGNDENEDMYAASLTGMDCFLVTDCMIESREHPWRGKRGTFREMVEMLEEL